ncbi:MAG: glycosyltransferase [Endomicrobiales bacterium]
MIPVLYYSNSASLARGGQKSLWYILRDLDKSLYRPVLACPEEGELTDRARALGIPVEILTLPRLRPRCALRMARCLCRFHGIIKKFGILLAHSDELTAIALLAALKPFTGIKLVWHVRVLWDTPFQKRVSLLLADRIICVSKTVADSFPAAGIVSVVRNGVDPREFSGTQAAPLPAGLEGSTIVVGYLAGLMELKGPHFLLRAASEVVKKHPGTGFLLVGGGPENFTEYLKGLARELNIRDNVVFRGEETKEPEALMKRFDIFVLPSLTEGLSRSLLEAMAMGKPVIASDIPQNAELVIPFKTGLLARAGDPHDLAGKIIAMIENDSLRRELGRNAREQVERDFSLKTTMEGIHAVYSSLGLTGERHHAGAVPGGKELP